MNEFNYTLGLLIKVTATIIFIGVIINIYLRYILNRDSKQDRKQFYKLDLRLEMNDFLLSEEGTKSAHDVATLCNMLGIHMESDQEYDEPDEMLT